MKKVIFQCSGALLATHLLLSWLLSYFPNFVTLFGGRQVNLYGLVTFLAMALVIRFFLRRYDWEDPEASLGELASVGGLAELFAQAIFQLVRQFNYPDPSEPSHVAGYVISVLGMSLMASIISYYFAGRIKKNMATRLISLLLLIGLGFAYRYLQAHGPL